MERTKGDLPLAIPAPRTMTEEEFEIRRTFLDGPPDLAVEIVSPDSVERDWREKYLSNSVL